MKTRPLFLFSLLGVLPCEAQISGSLTPPPGPPVSVMRTLEHIESRIPLVAGAPGVTVAPSGTITIAAPGSYFLAADLAVTGGSGLIINSSRVTVDLRGFAISSSAGNAAGDGVDINGSHISIYNGHIVSGTSYDSGAAGDQFTGPGFANGINATSLLNHLNIRLRDLTVSGMDLHGIYAASRSTCTVESCIVNTCGGIGIHAGLVRDSIASNCGGYGIFADTATSCRAISVGADGINAGLVSNCQGTTTSSDPSSDGIQSSYLVESSFGQVLGSQGGDGIKGFNVKDSHGWTLFSQHEESDGIEATGTVSGCYGNCRFGKRGISGRTVLDSEGRSTASRASAVGIEAKLVQNSFGSSAGADGIFADQVLNSQGTSGSTDPDADGIQSAYVVENSYGQSAGGDGIRGFNVSNSFGRSPTSTDGASNGIEAGGAVENSYGESVLGGTALVGHNVDNSYGKALSDRFDSGGIESSGVVRGSTGTAERGEGIHGQAVIDSEGRSNAQGDGISAESIVSGSHGEAMSGDGIVAKNVINSLGQGVYGINANSVINSSGEGVGVGIYLDYLNGGPLLVIGSTGTAEFSDGILSARGVASNCVGKGGQNGGVGISGFRIVDGSEGRGESLGIFGDVIRGSYGRSAEVTGVRGTIVESSIGRTDGPAANSPLSIDAEIGIGNVGEGGSESITHKYLAP